MGRLSTLRGAFLRLLNTSMNIRQYTINLDDDLTTKVINLQKIIPSSIASNNGGWQGVINDRSINWVENLRVIIEHVTDKMTQRFWFNINGPGHSNNWHSHFTNCSAAVLYINVPVNSGDIEFKNEAESFILTPSNGLLLVFPGTLEHRVLPNLSQEYRISLATNLV